MDGRRIKRGMRCIINNFDFLNDHTLIRERSMTRDDDGR